MKNEHCWYKDVCSEECSQACIRYLEMKVLMDMSMIPKNKQLPDTLYPEDCDVDAFHELANIKSDIVNFVMEGEQVYIYSKNPGNGKTSWAIKLMLKYFNEVWAGNGFKPRGLFIHVPSFLNALKNFNSVDEQFEEVKKLLPDIDLVIWDDIGSTGLSQYDHSQLLTFLDKRVLAGKANIYTGNLKQAKFEANMGVRIASRVWNNSQKIEFVGRDRR